MTRGVDITLESICLIHENSEVSGRNLEFTKLYRTSYIKFLDVVVIKT